MALPVALVDSQRIMAVTHFCVAYDDGQQSWEPWPSLAALLPHLLEQGLPEQQASSGARTPPSAASVALTPRTQSATKRRRARTPSSLHNTSASPEPLRRAPRRRRAVPATAPPARPGKAKARVTPRSRARVVPATEPRARRGRYKTL